MSIVPPGLRIAAVSGVLALAVSACQFSGLYSVPLPGDAATGSHVYRVHAIFHDVLDLVPNSSVRLNGVTVGSVQKITLTPGYQADVELRLPDSVHLPANAVAVLSQTSLLGEKFIALEQPAGTPRGVLKNGDVLSNVDTSADATVEEVFSALAALLNGGGVEQLQTINTELAQTLHGRESHIRDLFSQLGTLVRNLDSQKGQIVRALDGVDKLSGELAAQRQTIATSLTDLGPGLRVLADQRAQLTGLLTALAKLGTISTRVINASEQNTVADLRSLEPVLGQLSAAGANLPHSLELLVDFPFPRNAQHAIPGDYTGLSINVDVASFLRVLQGAVPVPGPSSPGLPSLPSLPSQPSLPSTGGLGSTLGNTLGGAGTALSPTPSPSVGSQSSGQGLSQLLMGALQ